MESMNSDKHVPTAISPQGDPAIFVLTMLDVENRESMWITKNRGSTLKTDTMFAQILLCLPGIPLKNIAHQNPLTLQSDALELTVKHYLGAVLALILCSTCNFNVVQHFVCRSVSKSNLGAMFEMLSFALHGKFDLLVSFAANGLACLVPPAMRYHRDRALPIALQLKGSSFVRNEETATVKCGI
jgi:hypothetical protein